MKELEDFLKNIEASQKGFRLGEPWKFSKDSLGVIVPILRENPPERDYTTLPEVKDRIKFTDTHNIDDIQVKGIDENLFIRAGTELEGIGTQSRGVTHSVIVEPKKEVLIDVRCIHASHPIHSGSGFKYSGRAPRPVMRALHKGDQGRVWGSVNHFYASMADRTQVPIIGSIMDSVQHDSLPQIKKAVNKLDKKLQNILKEVPVLENQIGAIIVGTNGVEGIEAFEHPDSWKAQYKEVIESYSDTLSTESKNLFTFDDSKVTKTIIDFLKELLKAKFEKLSSHTFLISLKGFIGEFVIVNGNLIHMFVMKNESNDEEPERARRPQSFRIADLGPTMKRGHSEIIGVMHRNHGHGLTWSELEGKTNMSTRTLSKRLQEGKKAGFIQEDIRPKNGKKVYKLKL